MTKCISEILEFLKFRNNILHTLSWVSQLNHSTYPIYPYHPKHYQMHLNGNRVQSGRGKSESKSHNTQVLKTLKNFNILGLSRIEELQRFRSI